MKVLIVAPIKGGHREFFLKSLVKYLIEKKITVVLCGNPDWEKVITTVPFIQLKFRKNKNLISVFLNWLTVIKIANRRDIDRVFFFSLDPFLRNYFHPMLLKVFSFPKWSGIFLHPEFLRLNLSLNKKPSISDRDIFLRHNKCQGVVIFDSFIKEKISNRIDRSVLTIPDLANVGLLTHSLKGKELIKKSKNRIIIGLFGTLSERKSVKLFLDLADSCEKDKYFFLIAGKFQKDINDKEYKKKARLIPNLIWFNEYFEDEKELNTLIKLVDIVFIFYKNFYGSSNFLTKAVYFNKWILCNSLGLINQTVEHYGFGESANTDINDIISKVSLIRKRIEFNDYPLVEANKFRMLNSQLSFEKFVDELVSLFFQTK